MYVQKNSSQWEESKSFQTAQGPPEHKSEHRYYVFVVFSIAFGKTFI